MQVKFNNSERKVILATTQATCYTGVARCSEQMAEIKWGYASNIARSNDNTSTEGLE